MTKYYNNILCCFIIGLIIVSQGCTSSVETKKEEKVRYEEKTIKTVKNIELLEREYIKSLKIKSIEKINFNLNAEGKPIKNQKLSTQTFNSDGLLIETIVYDSQGKIEYKYSYDYDKNRFRIKTARNNSKGEMTNYFTYEYNEYGNKTKAKRFNSSGVPEEYYIYSYDREGNLIEEEWFSTTNTKIYNIENEFNNDLKTESKTYDENGDLINKYIFRYDDKKNIVEEIKYDGRGLQMGVIQYVYKYF